MTPVRTATLGLAHPHIVDMTRALLQAGAVLTAFHDADDALAAAYAQAFPQARRVADLRAILDDVRIALVLCASAPAQRAGLAIQAMRQGKDVLVDKPVALTLDQLTALREAQSQTGRIFAVWFSERLAVRACTRASALVAAGAIGKVVQTVGLGPHRLGPRPRPAWFYRQAGHGGILCDLASHQFEQFLHYTGSTQAEVVAAQAGNLAHPQHPGLQDFGDALVRGDGGSGYLRVDWLTSPGLPSWGDGRLTLLGTEGHIEARKTLDLAGRAGADHLFLVNADGVRHFDCRDDALPFAADLLQAVGQRGDRVRDRAREQAHCFLALQLALQAQALARPPTLLPPLSTPERAMP